MVKGRKKSITKRVFSLLMCAAFVFAGIFGGVGSKAEAATYWFQDYTYSISDGKLILKRYKGKETELTVPGTVTIMGTKYKVALDKPEFDWWEEDGDPDKGYEVYMGPWSFTGVKKLTIKSGVIFPKYSNSMFGNMREVEEINIIGANTADVTSMESMFESCYQLKNVKMTGVNVSKVVDMSYMFSNCYNLINIDLTGLSSARLKSVSYMFSRCESLQRINLSGFNLTRITMDSAGQGMFEDCASLERIDTPINVKINIKLPAAYYNNSLEGDDYEYYDCIETNLPKDVDYSCNLTREYPGYEEILTDQKVIRGSKAKFSFYAYSEGNLSYKWEVSCDGGKTWEDSGATGCKTNTISMVATKGLNGRIYRCRVTDKKYGYVMLSNPAKLTTLAVISGQPANASVAAGKTASFTVKSRSTKATFQWQVSTDGGKKWVNSGAAGATTSTIKFTAKAKQNGYKYRCVVKNGTWEEKSKVVTLTVK